MDEREYYAFRYPGSGANTGGHWFLLCLLAGILALLALGLGVQLAQEEPREQNPPATAADRAPFSGG